MTVKLKTYKSFLIISPNKAHLPHNSPSVKGKAP